MKRLSQSICALMLMAIAVTITSCGESSKTTSTSKQGGGKTSGERPRVAFVTNQVHSFWSIAEAGCKDAEKDFDCEVVVKMPAPASVDKQKDIVEDLLSTGIQGIAISPIDAKNQAGAINEWAAKIPLITHDSDAPDTNRMVYVGMDNYKAGRSCGELLRKAIPDGGEVLMLIGRLEQDNAKKRWQGAVDALAEREYDAERYEGDATEPFKAGKFTILPTKLTGDEERAKQQTEDALNSRPKIVGIIGLFAYDPPGALAALKSAKRVNLVKIAAFDESKPTLDGIKDGSILGTVVQDPYSYGYKSVEVLLDIIKGNEPKQKFYDCPAKVITKENVDEFEDDLNSKIAR